MMVKAEDYRKLFERALEEYVDSSASRLTTVSAWSLYVWMKEHSDRFPVPIDEPGFKTLLGWYLSERFGKLFDGEVIYDKTRPRQNPNGGQKYVVVPAAMVFGAVQVRIHKKG